MTPTGEGVKNVDKLFPDGKPSEPETIVIDQEDKVGFLSLNDQDRAWNDLINTTNAGFAKVKENINASVKKFWDTIVIKYKLDTKKNYKILPQTGEITEVPKIQQGGGN